LEIHATPLCLDHPISHSNPNETVSAQKHQNDTITSQEPILYVSPLPTTLKLEGRTPPLSTLHSHLADISVLVHWSAFLAVSQTRRLRPHLLDVLQNHVAMAIESLDAGEEFAVVANGDENLDVRAHSCLKKVQGTSGELVLLELRDLVLANGKKSVAYSSRLQIGRGGAFEGRFVREFITRLREKLPDQVLASRDN
jgi:hypothetical protein